MIPGSPAFAIRFLASALLGKSAPFSEIYFSHGLRIVRLLALHIGPCTRRRPYISVNIYMERGSRAVAHVHIRRQNSPPIHVQQIHRNAIKRPRSKKLKGREKERERERERKKEILRYLHLHRIDIPGVISSITPFLMTHSG